jgi:hypothetical protein
MVFRLPQGTVRTLRELHVAQLSALEPQMRAIASAEFSVEQLSSNARVIDAWAIMIAFQRWLNADDDIIKTSTPKVSVLLARKVMMFQRQRKDSPFRIPLAEYCSSILSVATEEMRISPVPERQAHLETLLASYIGLCNCCDRPGECSSILSVAFAHDST